MIVLDNLEYDEKLKRISEEVKKLNKLFAGMELKTKKAVHSIIENAAFMAISLEDLQEIINREGYIEEYQNGATQTGYKKSSSVEVYNAMVKNHSSAMKQLTDLLPKIEVKPKGDGLDDFVNNRDK